MSEHEDEIRAKCAYLIDKKIIKSPATKEDLICEMYELSLYRDAYLRLREAVEFYSDRRSYDYWKNTSLGQIINEEYVQKEGGKRARLALKEADEILGAKG